MAITTLDGALAGMQSPQYFTKVGGTMVVGRPYSYWMTTGAPSGALLASQPSSLNGTVQTSSSGLVGGQMPHYDPVTGNSYLARLQMAATTPGQLLLIDRLWANGGYTMTATTAQTITSPTWPARDNNGTTNGDGVFLAMEVMATTGSGTPTITVAYTNSAGTASRSATNIDATVATAASGSFFRMALQSGDIGVRSVQSVTLSATWTSGTINLVAYRVLASMELTLANVPNAIDALTSGFPRVYNGAVPCFVFLPSATTASVLAGTYVETQG